MLVVLVYAWDLIIKFLAAQILLLHLTYCIIESPTHTHTHTPTYTLFIEKLKY